MNKFFAFTALGITWLILFGILTFFTQLIMVPWDTAITQPELGTWQRTLNDFFASVPGYFLFSASILVMSIVLSLKIIRGQSRHLLILIAGNIVFAVVLWGVFLIAISVNNAVLFPYPDVNYYPSYAGFHRSIFPGLCILLVCAIWLFWQKRAHSRKSILV